MATSPVDLKRSHFTSKTEKSSVSMFDRWGGNPFVFKRKDSAESVSMSDRWKGNPFIIEHKDGGPGSGNFGHAGRPGERGGSTPGPYHKLNDKAKELVEAHKKNPYHFGESLDQKMATRSTLIKELKTTGVRVIDNGEDNEPFRYTCLDPDLSYYECAEIGKALSQSIYSFADRDAYIEACRAEGKEPRLSEPAEEFPQEYLISNSGKSQTDGTPVYTSLDKDKLLSDNDIITYSGTDKALNPEESEKAEQATKNAVDSMSDEELSAIHGYTKQYGSATSYEINNYLATGEGTETTKKASEQLTSALDHEIGVDCITCRGASTVHGTDQDPKVRKLIDKVSRGDFSSAQQLKEMLEGKTITSNTVLSTSPNTTTSEYDQRPVQFIFKTPHNAKGVNITGVSAYGGGRSNAEKALAATGIFGSEQHETEVAFKPGTRYTIDRVEYAVDTRGKKRKGQVYIVATIHADNDDSRTDGGPGSGNHGHKGVPGQRGGSAPNGGTRSRDNLIPKGSYTESKAFKETAAKAHKAIKTYDESWARREELEEALKSESRPKPQNEWDEEDEFNAIIGNRPMIYTEKGKELKKELDAETKRTHQASTDRDQAFESMQKIKKAAHDEQVRDWHSSKPEPAKSGTYQGFTTKTTGTSFGDELLSSGRGYIAEMSPEEYLKRCAYDIFTDATIESTIHGTTESSIKKYADMMQSGTEFDLPYLDYSRQEQEGRHRALAAYYLGIDKIPVLVVGYPNSDGGEGSGNFGHEGRPGEVGGSAPSDGSPASPESAHTQGRAMMKMTKRRANDTLKELSRKGTGSDADRTDAHKEAKKLLDDLPVGSIVKLPDYWNDDGTGDKLKKTDNGWLCTNNGDHYVISTDSLAEYVVGADGDEADLPQVITVAMSAEEKRLADEAYERSYWRNNAHIWQEDGSFDKEMTIQLHRAKDLKTCGEGFILKGSDGRDYVKYGDEWYDSETYQKADMRKLNDPKFTGDFFDINFGMNGVSAEECQRMREAYATMPEHMRSRYETAFRETTFVPSYKGVSYFDPSTGNIHFDTNADADAIVHEVAHSLDYGACSMEFTTAGYSYKRNTASSCIQELGDTTEQRSEDFAAMARIVGYETKDGWFTGKHEGVSGQSERFSVWIKFCHEHDNIPGFSLVSDCISGLTMGQCGEEFFGGGHSQEYWSSYHPRLSSSSRSVEYWAEFCALKAMGYTEALSLLKQVTPNMYDAAEKVFEEVFK